jgi:hypothetical protein
LIDHFLNNGAVPRPSAGTPRVFGPETAANRIVEIIEKSRE